MCQYTLTTHTCTLQVDCLAQGHVPALSAPLLQIMCLVGTPGSLPPSLMCSLCTLVQWTFSGSSVQATIPFTMLQDMNILLECDSISDIQERLRVDRKLYCRLKSCLGQPVVVDIFLHLHTCTESQSKVVIKFLSHLTKNVSYSLPSPDLQLVQDKVSSCYYNMFGSQPAQREVSISHKETEHRNSQKGCSRSSGMEFSIGDVLQ